MLQKKLKLRTIIVIYALSLFTDAAYAKQSEKLDNGNLLVEWDIIKGKTGYPVIEYTVRASTQLEFEKIVNVLLDVEKHKFFNDMQESKILKKISDDEWIIYYYQKAPWPLHDAETIAKMVMVKNNSNGNVQFILKSYHGNDFPENPKIIRFNNMETTYSIEKSGKTNHIKIHFKNELSEDLPTWLIEMGFPAGPERIIKNLIKLVSR